MEHVRTLSREFATGDKAVLHLESRSGEVIVEGRETDRVAVDAVVRVWTDLSTDADDAAALVERNMEQDGHRVIIRAPTLDQREGWGALFGRSPRIDYHVRLPRHSAVRVLSRSGAVQIAHVEGVVHSEALSGKIGIEDVKGDVSVVSRSGNVLIERITGDVIAEARSGKLRLNQVEGIAQLEARSGTIEAEQVKGDLRITARSGTVNIEHPGGKVHLRAHAGSVRFKGRVFDDVEIEANAGSITFAADPDFPFFVEAESSVGSVRSDLRPRRNGVVPPAGGPRVRLRTRAGSIRLTKM
ncbi:MAG TPA: DUF4097 family beta strand repeat-containing protein [Dehalococcoidia bacterium]